MPSDWVYNAMTQEYVNSVTSKVVTVQQVRQMPDHLRAQIMGPIDDGPLLRPLFVPKLVKGMVVRFKTHKRFTYLTYYIPLDGKDEAWYITGEGKWFGTNALTNDQMSEVLMRDTTSEIRIMLTSDEDAHARLT